MAALEQCSQPGCPLPVVNDAAWHAIERHDVCARHRQLARLRAGCCPNCGHPVATVPIMNSLTGMPRTSSGVPQVQRQCSNTACGYVLRAQHGKGRRHGS